MKAFILSRPRDLPLAELSAREFLRYGWTPFVLLDPCEWPEGFPLDPPGISFVAASYGRTGRMHGVPCGVGIAEAILTHAKPGDVVAKMDCDTRVHPARLAWFAGAEKCARIFALTNGVWGGCWAAPFWQVLAVRVALKTRPPCDCPESILFSRGFQSFGGREVERVAQAKFWRAGEPWPAGAGAATLFPGSRERVERGRELFGIDLAPEGVMFSP
jgi:hypothetical protein